MMESGVRSSSSTLVWKPCDLSGEKAISLLPGLVYRGLPSLILTECAEFEVFVKSLRQRRLIDILRRPSRDEVVVRLVLTIGELHVLLGREMVGQPKLSPFGLASDPIPDDHALVGIALFLDILGVEIVS